MPAKDEHHLCAPKIPTLIRGIEKRNAVLYSKLSDTKMSLQLETVRKICQLHIPFLNSPNAALQRRAFFACPTASAMLGHISE